jgi:hypothetical protein
MKPVKKHKRLRQRRLNRRSLGTSRGMRKYYRTVPYCKQCKQIHLVTYDRREIGMCAGCEREFLAEVDSLPEITNG